MIKNKDVVQWLHERNEHASAAKTSKLTKSFKRIVHLYNVVETVSLSDVSIDVQKAFEGAFKVVVGPDNTDGLARNKQYSDTTTWDTIAGAVIAEGYLTGGKFSKIVNSIWSMNTKGLLIETPLGNMTVLEWESSNLPNHQ